MTEPENMPVDESDDFSVPADDDRVLDTPRERAERDDPPPDVEDVEDDEPIVEDDEEQLRGAAGPDTVVVAAGESLSVLAKRHNTTVAELQRLNNMGSTTLIRTGQQLVIRDEPSSGPAAPGGRVVLLDNFDGPDKRPYLPTRTTTGPWYVEPGSANVDRIGGKLVKRDSKQFHRIFSSFRFGGPGKTVLIQTRVRATRITNRSGSSIVEGVKLGLKFPNPNNKDYSPDDPRSAHGNKSATSPGSHIIFTGCTENGYIELSRNGYGTEGYKFWPNKRLGYKVGDWRDVTVEVTWVNATTLRFRMWHDLHRTGKPIYEAVDTQSPFGRAKAFLWLRTDDADWEYDYVRVTEL